MWLTLWVSVASATDWRPGVEPLDVGLPTEELPSKRCEGCHRQPFADWQGSRHRVAHTNVIYQAGLVAEAQSFCVYCHSPLTAQAAEVIPNLKWYASHDPRFEGDAPLQRGPEPLSEDGVGCVACHVRDGVIQARSVSGLAPHESTSNAGLTDGSLCRSCHEFSMPVFRGGQTTLTDTPMQATWSEWVAWRDAGGQQTCVDCHMPDGRHTFPGAHARGDLARSVQVETRRRDERLVFTIRSQGVGHLLPSGDLFRNLTLEVEEDGAWKVVHRIGHRFELRVDPQTGHAHKERVDNTSLVPGEPAVVTAVAPQRTAWRLVYHYGAPHDERRGLIPADQLTAVLASGRR